MSASAAPLAPAPAAPISIRPEDHLALVGYLARRACERLPPGMDWDDLRQEGAIGLLIAAQRFNPARGIKFSSFAGLCIRQRLQEALRRGRRLRRERPMSAMGNEPSPEELPYEETIPARPEPEACAGMDVQALLQRLPPREREVLSLRFGLDGQGEKTLEEIGEQLGVTRQRVDQVVRHALGRMRGGAAA